MYTSTAFELPCLALWSITECDKHLLPFGILSALVPLPSDSNMCCACRVLQQHNLGITGTVIICLRSYLYMLHLGATQSLHC